MSSSLAKNKILKYDIITIYLLFTISVVTIYKLPSPIIFLFQIILLLSFYYSTKDYFWLAFIFIVESNPGGLFTITDASHTFSVLSTSFTGNLYFWIPFSIVALYKTRKIEFNYPNYFLRGIIFIIGVYFLYLLAANGIYKWNAIIRLTLPWLMLYLITRLMVSSDDYAKFFNLIFAFLPFIIVTQIFKLATANDFVTLFGGVGNLAVFARQDVFDSGTALRPTAGIFIPFLSILGSTYFLTKKSNEYFNRNHLLIVIVLSFFGIFITATRSWLIAVIFIIVAYSFINLGHTIRSSLRYTLLIFLFIALIPLIPALNKQAELAINRYDTISYLLQGDITAGGTLKRLDVRSPKVMAKFEERPIFGWGFGKEGASYSDGHVGNQNLLMHGGVIGYSLFLILWLQFIFKMLNSQKLFTKGNEYYKTPYILISFFIGILIINISVQWFGFLTSFTSGFTIAIVFSLGNMIFWEAHKNPNTTNNKIK